MGESRLAPIEPQALAYDKLLYASLDASRRSPLKLPPRATSRVGRITRGPIASGRSFGTHLALDVLACPKCQGG